MTATSDSTDITREVREQIREHKALFWIGGILSILFGALAIAAPFLATLAAEITLGGLLAAGGFVMAVMAFRARSASRIASALALGLLALAAGVLLLANPISGLFAITTVLIAYFLASGLTRLYYAFRLRPCPGWGWMAFGGALSIALAILILLGLPSSAFWALGLLLGVDFLFYGVTLIALVSGARRDPAQPDGSS